MNTPVTGLALLGVFLIAVTSTAGDTLVAAAMRRLGPLDRIYRERGAKRVAVVLGRNRLLVLGIGGMALSFFSLLWTLSFADLSFVSPASTALSFVFNSVAASLFLAEHVGTRRWIAAVLIGSGVFLLAH
jgi:drug/metabolite transporter (DMT)-like permease